MTPKLKILIVDADEGQSDELRQSFEDQGYTVDVAGDVPMAERRLEQSNFDAMIAALRLPGGGGLKLLGNAHAKEQGTIFFLLARDPAVHDVVEAIRRGAVDVLEEPVFGGHATAVVAQGLSDRKQAQSSKSRPKRTTGHLSRPPIIGRSPALKEVLDTLKLVTQAPRATVLIEGESGTGKELIARAIHYDGPRADCPFLAVNCATLTENLLEAELFGYEAGAFTGAHSSGKQGLFEVANGGTLFLDEIGELAPSLQAKLLRVLQEGAFKRVGGVRDISIDVRIIAATNRALRQEVQESRFRADLYYRLNVVPLLVPRLQDRQSDIPELAQHFVSSYGAELGKSLEGLSDAALEELKSYEWPGNIRELRNVCEYAAIVCDSNLIESRHLRLPDHAAVAPATPSTESSALPTGDRSLKSMESELIRVVLSETRFNVTRAATILGINRSTLYNKMRDYGLQRDERPKMLRTV